VANDQVFERLDAKLGALLAIAVDQYLRETGVARPNPRSIDKMLSDVGLAPRDVAALLGKTERAVYLALSEEQKKSQERKKKRQAKGSEGPSEAVGM
jgi:hypothetical protein